MLSIGKQIQVSSNVSLNGEMRLCRLGKLQKELWLHKFFKLPLRLNFTPIQPHANSKLNFKVQLSAIPSCYHGFR